MVVHPCNIPGLLKIEPTVYKDSRGFFLETYNARRYQEAGLNSAFVQDNLSKSSKGVLRGLHFQNPFAQGKLVSVLEGRVYDVAVDIRKGSPTFGKWEAEILDGERKNQFYIPPGLAHGFEVLSDHATFFYKCTEVYHKESEYTLAWDDPDLGIPWNSPQPLVSEKDSQGQRLRDFTEEMLPGFQP